MIQCNPSCVELVKTCQDFCQFIYQSVFGYLSVNAFLKFNIIHYVDFSLNNSIAVNRGCAIARWVSAWVDRVISCSFFISKSPFPRVVRQNPISVSPQARAYILFEKEMQ